MVGGRPKNVDLTENSRFLTSVLREQKTCVLDLVVERNLGTRQYADRYTWFSNCCKSTTFSAVEFGSDQLVANLGGPGRDMMQAVIAHLKLLLGRTAGMVALCQENLDEAFVPWSHRL